METILQLKADSLDDEQLQKVTLQLCKSLVKEDISASLPDNEGRQGAKGDPITIGSIILTLIGSGGVAVTLINVFNSYIQKVPQLEFVFKDGDKEIKITGKDIQDNQIQHTLKEVKKLIKD